MSWESWAFILFVIFISSLIRVVFGFGNALIAMPLLAMSPLTIREVTPLVALVAITMAVYILVKDWRNVRMASAWRLVLSSLFGIPVGVALLSFTDETVVKIFLALLIIAFSVFSLMKPEISLSLGDRWAYPFGFISGILGGAYNTNGPPVVIYGTLRKWPPGEFRSTLQGYFFPTGLLIIASHAAAGLLTVKVWTVYALSLAPIVGAVIVGTWIYNALPQQKYELAIHLLLIAVATALLLHVAFT